MTVPLPPRTPWVQSLPARYFAGIEPLIERLTAKWFTPELFASGFAHAQRALLTYGRMSVCAETIMPWLKSVVPGLDRMTVLEVGCGNGCSTPPMAMAARRVLAFDILGEEIEIARRRCELLGLNNVSLFTKDTSWIAAYAADWRSLVEEPVDLIYCYALLEHLLPLERIAFLRGAWNHLSVGGLLVTVELPNRFTDYDWHSSHLMFADALPHDLLALAYARSPRPDMWAGIRAHSIQEALTINREHQYRFGRGASWHEFELALGDRFEVVADGTSGQGIDRQPLGPDDPEWRQALSAKLERLGIHRAFAQTSLDLVLRRTV